MAHMNEIVTVVGGGLAGAEAAWQIAERGLRVRLYEMRPRKMTPAHTTGHLAELVCSNSLGSDLIDRAPGLLKDELRKLGSLLIRCAAEAAVPAGGALAVDREMFAQTVTQRIASHPRIEIIREEVTRIPTEPAVIATGPLTSDALAADIARLTGSEYLYFWDAIAPVVTFESIDFTRAFRASRFGRHSPVAAQAAPGDAGADTDAGAAAEIAGDYINCPMTREEYEAFVDALLTAETATLRDFELRSEQFFEGCLPIEVLARRGRQALAFGPMRPIGIRDPHTNRRPYAVVQLRQDNLAGSLYNLVGFQTNLKFPEQERVLRMIPGLASAEFVRFGQMHRNTFINSPALLEETMRYRHGEQQGYPALFFAGQIVGVEGYAGNIATGLVAGLNIARLLTGQPLVSLPPTTMIGALCHYVCHAEAKTFQPMKANFGILPPLEGELSRRPPHDKRARAMLYVARAQTDLNAWLAGLHTRQAP